MESARISFPMFPLTRTQKGSAYVYDIWGVAVVAGNRPFGKRPDIAVLEEFDARARVFIEAGKSFESDEVQSLLSDFADVMERA